MKKTIITMLAVAIIVSAGPVFAQSNDLPEPGILPGSPAYFIKGFFEGVGTFFTFGNSAKAERHLYLAEKRLAEAQVLAERGDERAQVAVARYEDQFAKANERAKKKGLDAVDVKTARQAGDPIPDIDITIDQPTSRNSGQDTDDNGGLDLLARVTDATTKHLTVLDGVLDKVPEQAKASIEAAKERSMQGQIESLREIAQQDPEVAAGVFERAVQARAGAYIKIGSIEGEALFEEDDEDMEEKAERSKTTEAKVIMGRRLAEEFELYTELGKEISALAEGLQAGETTVEEIVERATSHYRDVLRDVQSKVPPQAQESIQRVINGSRPNADLQTAPSSQPQRSIPENSIERNGSDSETEEAEVERGTEAEAEIGGPPAMPAPVPR
jgi:hypothetical protein